MAIGDHDVVLGAVKMLILCGYDSQNEADQTQSFPLVTMICLYNYTGNFV